MFACSQLVEIVFESESSLQSEGHIDTSFLIAKFSSRMNRNDYFTSTKCCEYDEHTISNTLQSFERLKLYSKYIQMYRVF